MVQTLRNPVSFPDFPGFPDLKLDTSLNFQVTENILAEAQQGLGPFQNVNISPCINSVIPFEAFLSS